jgi:Holliday junction resolvasome RuvABC endonuclease subunit
MNIIGIDFSILYPGVCISNNFRDFKWVAVTNNRLTKKDNLLVDEINNIYKNIHITKLGERKKKTEEYYINERNKLDNYEYLINTLIHEIKKHTTEVTDNIIAIEGISFGSKGNSLVDISQATGILKSKLINQLTDSSNKIFVFSPSELKNSIGCSGNASKKDIFLKFKTDPIIDKVKNSDLFKLLNDKDVIFDGKNIKSPYMDMIDSYLPILKIYNIFQNNQTNDGRKKNKKKKR